MAITRIGEVESALAGADLSAKQYFCTKITGQSGNDLTVDLAGAGDRTYGVLQDKPVQGRIGGVMTRGITKVVTNGTTPIIAGDFLKSGTGGKAVKAASDKDHAFAVAMEPSSADGTIIGAELRHMDLGV